MLQLINMSSGAIDVNIDKNDKKDINDKKNKKDKKDKK